MLTFLVQGTYFGQEDRQTKTAGGMFRRPEHLCKRLRISKTLSHELVQKNGAAQKYL